MTDFLNQAGLYWGVYFGWVVVQNTAFLALVFLVLHLIRRTPAHVRYIVGVIGLAKLLLPPFFPFVMQGPNRILPAGLRAAAIGDISVFEQAVNQPFLSLWSLLFVVWCLTVFSFFIFNLCSTVRMRRKLSESAFLGTVPQTGIKTYKSEMISSPMSIGLFPQKLYFPSFWLHLPLECREVLTEHELAHIRRRDGVIQFLQILVQALYFFHPLVWLLNERLYEYREMACDDEAVEKCRLNKTFYSRYLVQIADRMLEPQWSFSSATALIKRRHKLLNRVQYQMEEQKMQKISPFKFRLYIALLVLLILPLSWYITRAEESANQVQAVVPAEKPVPGTTGKIYGQVIDKKTGEALPGANVLIEGTTMGAATDREGNFSIIHVPPGKYKVVVHFIGYKSVAMDNVFVKVEKSTQLKFELETAIIEAQKITIPADRLFSPKPISEEAPPPPPTSVKPESEEPPPPPPPAPSDEKMVFVAYDEAPEPIGGYETIAAKLKFSNEWLEQGEKLITYIQVTVDVKGLSQNVKVNKSCGVKALDEAAVNAVKETRWHPAKQRDKTVSVRISFPIVFKE
ncbi:TonB family protein [candidate division KSB1 bacterium]|nr:TonB family protein [candidate division KSB1 bacterium]